MEDNSDLEDFPVKLETIKWLRDSIEKDPEALRQWMIFIRRLDNLTPADIHNLSEKNRKGEDIRLIMVESLELWIKRNTNATFLSFLQLLEEESLRNLKHELHRAYDQIKGATFLGIKNEKLWPSVSSAGPTGSADVHQTAKKWNVPLRNTNFIGRTDVLEEINLYFSDKQDHTLLGIIHGLGGIGKSSTALEYVWTNLSKYSRICWFHAETRNKLFADYMMLTKSLLPDHMAGQVQPNSDELLTLLKQWFEDPENSGWLLVYDNCSTYDEIADMLPVSGGNILITSRYSIWHEGQTFELRKFDPAETKAYAHKILGKRIPMSDIEALGQEFDHFPLAIAQACAYIKCSPMTIPEYLKTYSRSKEKWLAKNSLPRHYNVNPVLFTWKLSIEKIQEELPLAVRWLEIMSCLDGDGIPHELLKIFVSWHNNNLGGATDTDDDDDDYSEVLKCLAKFSMIRVDKERELSTIHRLVQEVILSLEGAGKRKELCVTSFFILTSVTAPVLFIEIDFGDSYRDFYDLSNQIRWTPHWAALLERAQAFLAKDPTSSVTFEFSSMGIKPPNCHVPSVSIEIQFLVRILLILTSRVNKSKTVEGVEGVEIPKVERACLLQQLVELWRPVFGDNSLVVANCWWELSRLTLESEQIVMKLEDSRRIYSEKYNSDNRRYSHHLFCLMGELADSYITRKELNSFQKGLEILTSAREYFEHWNPPSLQYYPINRCIRTLIYPSIRAIMESKAALGKELANCLRHSLQNIESCSGLALTILILAIETENHTPILFEMLDRASASLEPGQGKKVVREVITSLTNKGHQRLSLNWTPLFYAVRFGCNEAIRVLLDYGVDPGFQNAKGETVIHQIILYNWIPDFKTDATFSLLLECILQKFESSHVTKILNAADDDGSTPFISLLQHPMYSTFEIFLEKCGSFLELDKVNNQKKTPLAIAILTRKIRKVKLLLEAGSSPTASDDHDSILHKAVGCEKEEILKIVMEAIRKVSKTEAELEQNFNPRDTEGDTPLMWAAKGGSLSQAKLLLKEKQVKLDLKNHDGLTALNWAIKNEFPEVVELLLDGAKENSP